MSLETRDTENWSFKAFGPKEGIQLVPSCRRETLASPYSAELLAISPDGEFFAAGSPSDEGILVLGKLSSLHSALAVKAEEIADLKTIERPGIVRVHFLANGKQIAVFTKDNTVELYNVPSLNLVTSSRFKNLAYSGVFSTKQGFVYSDFCGVISVVEDNKSTSVQANSPVFCIKKSDDTLVYADELELPSIAGKVFWMGEIAPGQLSAVAQDTSDEDAYKLFIQNGAGLDEWLCVEEACPVFDFAYDEVCWFSSSVPSFPTENQYTTIAACSMSTEMLLLTSEAKLRVMDDSDKLPFTTDDEDVITVGACLDLSDSTDVVSPINGVSSASHLPLWLVLTQEGRILAWHVVSKDAISNKIKLFPPKAAEVPDLTLISATKAPISEEEVDEISDIGSCEDEPGSPVITARQSSDDPPSDLESPLDSSISDDAGEDSEASASQEGSSEEQSTDSEGPSEHASIDSRWGPNTWLSDAKSNKKSSALNSSSGPKPSRLADKPLFDSGESHKSPFSSALNTGSDKEKFSGFSKQSSDSVSGKFDFRAPANSSSPFAETAKPTFPKPEASPFAEFTKKETPEDAKTSKTVSGNSSEAEQPDSKLPLALSQSPATEISKAKPSSGSGEQATAEKPEDKEKIAPGEQNSREVPANESPFSSNPSKTSEVRDQTSLPVIDSAKGDDCSPSAASNPRELSSGNLKTLVDKLAFNEDSRESLKDDSENKGDAMNATKEDTSPKQLGSNKDAQDKLAADTRANEKAEFEAKHAAETKAKEAEKVRLQAEAELAAVAKREQAALKAAAEKKKKMERAAQLTSTEWIGEVGTQFAQLKSVLQDRNLTDLVDFDGIYCETNILFQVVDQNLQILEGNDEYETTKLSEELEALSAEGFNARGDVLKDGPHIADLLSIMKKYNASVANLNSIKDSTSSLSDLAEKLTDDVEQLKDECLRANAELEVLETQISEEAFYLRPLSIETEYRKDALQNKFSEAVELLKTAKRSALSLMLSNSRSLEIGNLIVAIDTIDSRLAGLEKQITRLKAAEQSSTLTNSLVKLSIHASNGQSSPTSFMHVDDKRPRIQSSMLLNERINSTANQLSLLESRSAGDILESVDC